MANDREYLKNKVALETVSNCFNGTINKFQQLILVYSQLEKSNQLKSINNKLKIKDLAEKIFEETISNIKTNDLRKLGSIDSNPQLFMYPIGVDKIIKIDFSKGDVRTIHIYEIRNQKTYSLSQSAVGVTLTATPFQKIYGIQEMDNNWRTLNKMKKD